MYGLNRRGNLDNENNFEIFRNSNSVFIYSGRNRVITWNINNYQGMFYYFYKISS